MRHVLLASVLAALLLTPLHGQSSSLDVTLPSVRIPAALQPCDIHGIVQKLGRITKLPVGFQGGPECIEGSDVARVGAWVVDQRFSTGGDTIDLAGSTLRQALDRVVALAPDYRWQAMNGVAVVRPVAAWNDPEDALNQRLPAVHLTDERFRRATVVGPLRMPYMGVFGDAPHLIQGVATTSWPVSPMALQSRRITAGGRSTAAWSSARCSA